VRLGLVAPITARRRSGLSVEEMLQNSIQRRSPQPQVDHGERVAATKLSGGPEWKAFS
jgi:hypothetical protein